MISKLSEESTIGNCTKGAKYNKSQKDIFFEGDSEERMQWGKMRGNRENPLVIHTIKKKEKKRQTVKSIEFQESKKKRVEKQRVVHKEEIKEKIPERAQERK